MFNEWSATGNLKGQVLKADGVAKSALSLFGQCRDEANYVSGGNLVLDCGFSVVNPTIMGAPNFNPVVGTP